MRRLGALLAATVVVAAPATAAAQGRAQLFSTPSDSRADFYPGNATTCADVGYPDDIQMGSPGDDDASDAYITGTVTDDKKVSLEITQAGQDAGVVVDAVMVKGGDGYNVYSDPDVLPPALPAPQDYISPLNGGGGVPTISHWFVCYHVEPPEPGELRLTKAVVAPDGYPTESLPQSYTVVVTCDAPGFEPTTVEFGPGGGVSIADPDAPISNLPDGTMCWAEEQDTDSFPEGSTVTWDPPEAGSPPGIDVTGDEGVSITVTNSFSDVPVEKGELQIVKKLAASDSNADLPEEYTVEVLCDDDTTGTVTLPGTGGPGSPVLEPTVGAECTVLEDTAGFPDGWTVEYTVPGEDPTTEQPFFIIEDEAAITVTVTNTAPEVVPTPTPTPIPEGPTLPKTGASPMALSGLAGVLILVGVGTLLVRRRGN